MKHTGKSKIPDQSDQPGNQSTIAGKGNDLAEAGNMDKIRDILFGNQAKDYEKRFIKMEARLAQEANELKEELLKRIDTLEIYIKQELKDINQRIKNESNERVDSQESIQRELKKGLEALTKKLLNEEENLAKKSTELRDQILEQSKQLSQEILTKYDQASGNLEQAAQELDTAKVNRSDLSGFFLELAMRLSGEDAAGSLGNLKG